MPTFNVTAAKNLEKKNRGEVQKIAAIVQPGHTSFSLPYPKTESYGSTSNQVLRYD